MVIALILAGQEVRPQEVRPQVVIGNTSFSSVSILKTFKGAGSQNGYSAVLELYKSNGFLQASIELKGDTILITEGKQFRLGEVKFSGNYAFRDSASRGLTSKGSDFLLFFQMNPFNETKFMRAVEKIISIYEDSGYPYCVVKIDSFVLWDGIVDAWLNIIEGPLIRISNIRLKGNNFTKDYVVLRELRMRRGDIFSETKLKIAEQRVNKLKFIKLVSTELVNQDELSILVKEEPVSYVDGVLGYGGKRMMGLIGLEIFNLIGTGRAISLKFEKADTVSTFFEMNYKEPWILGYPIDLIASFSHRTDFSYVKNRAELLLDMPITRMLTITIGGSGTWVANISRYREVLGLDFTTNSVPGIRYHTKSEWDLHKLEEIAFGLDNYLGVPNSIILFLSLNFSAVLRDQIEEYDKLKLGGVKSIRGYWENEFSGAEVGWLNIEVHKFIFGESFVFPFYDIGYLGDSSSNYAIKQSFGIGVAGRSPIGMIKIIYALAKGKDFMDGKIHLALKSTF
jgi:outer membrane protein insertion porin family